MQPAQMHEGYAPEYQRSAIPFVTASLITSGQIHTYTFDYVTKFFSIKNAGGNTGDKIAIGFTENGLGTSNYFTLLQDGSFREELRCVKLFVSGVAGIDVDYELVAGLTAIPHKNFLTITGSNGYQGVG